MRFVRLALIASLMVLSMAQVKMPFTIISGGGGGGAVLTSANFTSLGTYRLSTPGTVDFLNTTLTLAGGRNVGGTDHMFVTQAVDPTVVGNWSPVELAASGAPSPGASWASATRLTYVQNWGRDAGNANPYDTYNGKFGHTYCINPNPGNNDCLGPGSTGQDYFDPSQVPIGGAYHAPYFYIEYSANYANYQANQHLIATDLSGGLGNTTTYGPFRLCEGVFGPSGQYSTATDQSCGPRRSGALFECPAGMCDGSTGAGTQDTGQQFGDSFFAFASWPGSSTPSGYGSNRGSQPYRSTDILPTHDYLSHYNLTSAVSSITGLITSGQDVHEATIRQKISGSDPYRWQGYSGPGHTSGESYVSPVVYAGTGTWVQDADSSTGNAYIDVTQVGYVGLYYLSTHDRWYRTTAVQTSTTPAITFDRGCTAGGQCEQVWIMPHSASAGDPYTINQSLTFTGVSANQHYTLAATNPGASHGSTTCSASGVAVTVSLKTDGSANVLSTANDVLSAINGTGACSGNFAAALVDGGDGTAVFPVITTHLIARGPLLSPIGATDCAVDVTGPCDDIADDYLAIYNPSDLEKTPDYTPQPSSWIRINDLDSTLRFKPTDFTGADTNRLQHALCGMWYSTTTHRLYICARAADTNDNAPLFHVLLASSTPAPAPSPVSASLPAAMLAVALWPWRRRPLTRTVSS